MAFFSSRGAEPEAAAEAAAPVIDRAGAEEELNKVFLYRKP